MIWLRIIVGIALLIAGRRLFWLFVGLIGFISGIHIAPHFFPGRPEWMILAIALVAGILGALIALFLQWLAIGLAGFSAGAYIGLRLLQVWEWKTGEINWIFFLIGGILGTLLIIVLFSWALIILSSLVGAGVITEAIHAGQWVTAFFFIALFTAGVVVQSRLMKMKPS